MLRQYLAWNLVLITAFLLFAQGTVAQAQHLRVRAGGGAAIHLKRTSQDNSFGSSPFEAEEYPSISDFYDNAAPRLDLDAAYLAPLSFPGARIAIGTAFARHRLNADESVNDAGEVLGERLSLTQANVYIAYEQGPVAGPMFYGLAGIGTRWYNGSTTFDRDGVEADYDYKPGFAAQAGFGGAVPLGSGSRWSLGGRLVIEYSSARRDVITFTGPDGSTETATPTGEDSLSDPSVSFVVLLGYTLPL